MSNTTDRELTETESAPDAGSSTVVAFFIGTAIGGVAGAVVGTLLSPYTADTLSSVYSSISKRLPGNRSDRPKFELLLQ